MKRIMLVSIALVGFLFTISSCSSYPRHRYGDRYDRYDSRYSSQIRELADDLEDATSRLEDEADDNDYYNSDYAVDRFEKLDEEAEDFRSEVNDERDLRRTDDDFRELLNAYSQARAAMSRSRFDRDVYRDFEQISQIMAQLSRAYGYSSREQYGYNPGRRY